jgi:3-oxoacyl-[acyl-carrier protein] reductase
MLNVIVTGGSRGLGLAMAGIFAAEGYSVIAVARSQSAELSDLITKPGPGTVAFEPFDFANTSEIAVFVRHLRKTYGSIHGLVNNAGIGTEGILATMPEADIEQLIKINTLAPVLLTKHVVRTMMADGGGRIVNISSIVASSGFKALSVYSATKASLLGFTRSLAREVGPLGITVNAVAPGFIETDLTKGLGDKGTDKIRSRSALKRMANADDVAHAVSYLLSDKAANITGTVITVDAGGTA